MRTRRICAYGDCTKAGKRGDVGPLGVGFYTSLSIAALRDPIFAFAARHAQGDVNFIEDKRSSLISLLERGNLDIVVILGEPTGVDFAHMGLWSEQIMVAFPKSHPLASREFVYWTDLKASDF